MQQKFELQMFGNCKMVDQIEMKTTRGENEEKA